MAGTSFGGPYTTGGVNPPKNHEENTGTDLQMVAACEGTVMNDPNVNNVEPGAHNAKGASSSAK